MITAHSQEPRKVVSVDPQMSDIYNVLNLLDIKMFRFDLTSFLSEKYSVNLYMDEYKNNQKIKRVRVMNLGENIKSLDEIPEEHREYFRKSKQVPEGKNEWNNIKEMSLYIRKKNDSIAILTIDIPDVMRMNQQMTLYPVSEFKTYFYEARPFVYNEMDGKEELNIPLVMYGSGWYDTKYKVVRFCGETKIDTDMKADILSNIPHHYVVGLELKKTKKTAK